MITLRTRTIGLAAIGENLDGSPIGIIDQQNIMKNASLAELVAVKVIIQQYHSSNMFASLLVDCYLNAKERTLRQTTAA